MADWDARVARIVDAVCAEFHRQNNDPNNRYRSLMFDATDIRDAIIDGRVDVRAMAEAILREIDKT